MTDTMGKCNGWTFDPFREVWWARIASDTWSEVEGTFDNPPTWKPGG